MKALKKNQIIIYVIALMLVFAGYLNFEKTGNLNSMIQASAIEEELVKMANIGDAQLVSSSVYSENNVINENLEKTDDFLETTAEVIKSSDYFTISKLDRDTMYSQMIETYENILNSTNSLETQKQAAQEEITKINNIKNSIMICENLIKTKGIDNIVIFVNGDSISVVVGKEKLEQEEVAQIQNIISREMTAKMENIHISTK